MANSELKALTHWLERAVPFDNGPTVEIVSSIPQPAYGDNFGICRRADTNAQLLDEPTATTSVQPVSKPSYPQSLPRKEQPKRLQFPPKTVPTFPGLKGKCSVLAKAPRLDDNDKGKEERFNFNPAAYESWYDNRLKGGRKGCVSVPVADEHADSCHNYTTLWGGRYQTKRFGDRSFGWTRAQEDRWTPMLNVRLAERLQRQLAVKMARLFGRRSRGKPAAKAPRPPPVTALRPRPPPVTAPRPPPPPVTSIIRVVRSGATPLPMSATRPRVARLSARPPPPAPQKQWAVKVDPMVQNSLVSSPEAMEEGETRPTKTFETLQEVLAQRMKQIRPAAFVRKPEISLVNPPPKIRIQPAVITHIGQGSSAAQKATVSAATALASNSRCVLVAYRSGVVFKK